MNIDKRIIEAALTKQAALKELNVQAKLSNQAYLDALANQLMSTETTQKLQQLIDLCTEEVNNNPIQKEGKQVQFRASKEYNLGKHYELIVGLLRGIQYAHGEHKPMLLAICGLSDDLVDRAVTVVGQNTYYSPRYETIVEGEVADANKVKEVLTLVGDSLGLTLDLDGVTQSALSKRAELAQINAEKAKAEHSYTKELESQAF